MLTLKRVAFVLILLGMSSTVQAADKAKNQKEMERSPAAVEQAARGESSKNSEIVTKPMNDEQMLVELQATLEDQDFSADTAEP